MKDIIIGLSLLWLIPFSIIVTKIILYNLKLGNIRDIHFYNQNKLKKFQKIYIFNKKR